MNHVIVTYTVKPGRADENAALVRAVFDALGDAAPDGFAYASYRDGDSFTHVASYPDGSRALGDLPAFQEFQSELRERCAVPPVLTRVAQVGAYTGVGSSGARRPATVG